jgi:hypothetical protein
VSFEFYYLFNSPPSRQPLSWTHCCPGGGSPIRCLLRVSLLQLQRPPAPPASGLIRSSTAWCPLSVLLPLLDWPPLGTPEPVVAVLPPPSLSGITTLSLWRRIASQRRRFSSTLPSTSSLILMQWRNLDRCHVKNFHFVSSFSTKSSSCRNLYSCA